MAKEGEHKSLFICGYCGMDTRKLKSRGSIRKIRAAGHSNMLCVSCERSLNCEMEILARKFLAKS